MTCAEGTWNKQVACEPVDCGVPDQHHVYAASFSCLEGTTFGSKCSFRCRHPAQLKGTALPAGDLEAASSSSSWGSNTKGRTGFYLCF